MELEKFLNDMPVLMKEAIKGWQEKNTAKQITQEVHNKLNKNKEEILLKLMGFENRWGKWEIDHCNGRNGNSPIGDRLNSIHSQALENWLNTIELPEPNPELINAVNGKFLRDLEYYLKQEAKLKAENLAREIVDKMSSDLLAETQTKLDNALKVESFLKS